MIYHDTRLLLTVEFAENGSLFKYLHEEHRCPEPALGLRWAKEIATGTMMYTHTVYMHMWPQ